MERRGGDYYTVLEVKSSASDIEIRRSYLRLSRQWHPDKALQNGITLADATSQFQLISVAYETLSDPNARRKYDIQQRRRQVPQDFGGFGFDFRGAQAHTWSGFNFGGSAYGFRAQPSASTTSTMTTGETWKAFIRNRISEEEFIRNMRNSFSSFEDGPNSFYDVFEKLFKDEIFAADKDAPESPQFGIGSTSWKNGPGPFYRYWSRFRTTKKLTSSESSASRSAAKSASGSNQAHRSLAKKQQKALYDAYNGKVHILVDLLQSLDPRVKAEELRQERRAEEQHSEKAAKLQAEREQRQKELAAERAARRRWEEEENTAESDDDLTNFGSFCEGTCCLVVTPDGLVMTCEQAVAAAAQDAARIFESSGSAHDENAERHADLGEVDKAEECAAKGREDDCKNHGCNGNSPEADPDTSSEPEVYRCEACRKYFKHVNQYEAHLASKKHKKEYSAWLERQQK